MVDPTIRTGLVIAGLVVLFLWGLYATSIIQVLATPVLGITLLLLIVERAFRIGIFDPHLDIPDNR